MKASVETAIVAAAILIGAAILTADHWEVTPVTTGPVAFRLDRWTGEIVICKPTAATISAQAGPLECGEGK